jgi:hypothetical protein
MESESRHQCLIYEGSPSEKLSLLATILQQKLNKGYRCLYLNSAPMVAGMRSAISALGTDVASEIAKGRIVMISEPVSEEGSFSIEGLLIKLEATLDEALSAGYKGLWASGDMTWEFAPENDFSKLLEYELKLEEMFKRRKELCGICQYHKDTLPRDAMRQALLVHPTIVINETLTRINPHYSKSPWSADPNTIYELDQTMATLYGT